MKKGLVLLLIVTLMMGTFIACNKEEEVKELDESLLAFLPEEGFQWGFKNNDGYYHVLTLDKISKDEQEVIYELNGEVKDNNIGEINDDYSITVFYTVKGNEIIQRIDPNSKMIESDFEEVVILKSPVEVGTQWRQEVVDKNNKKKTLECKITAKKEENNTTVYEVLYKSKDGEYIALRQIATEYGVLKFVKKNVIDGEQTQVGYALDGPKTGYVDNTDDVADEDDKTADGTDDTEDPQDTTDDTTDDIEDDKDQDETDVVDDEETEEEAVETAINDFNDAWINYVNNGDKEYFDYITTDGVAYKYAKKFDRKGLTEEFLEMNVKSVNVKGSKATAKVYEEIKKTKDGNVSIAKYNWIYNLEKVNGKWLVDGYKKQ